MKNKSWLSLFLILAFAGVMSGQAYPDHILQGEKRVVIPFSYNQHFIVVPVKFFGVLPLNFIYDTGAEHTLLFKKEYTDILGLEYQKRIPILGADQSMELDAFICRDVKLQIHEMPSVEEDILVLEEDIFNLEKVTGVPIDGLLGTNFFRNLVVEVNYKNKLLIIHDPAYFSPGRKFQEINVHFKNNKPYTFAKTLIFGDTSLNLELLFDSGAGLPLLLHNNTHPMLALPEKTITGRIGMGLGGVMKGFIGKIVELDIGSFQFNNLITSFQDLEDPLVQHKTKARNGLIGNQILSKFTVVIDFPRNKMYLKPNRYFRKKIKYDKSGLILFAVGAGLDQYLVQDVVDDSPADIAGIFPGDKIVGFGWFPANWYSLDRITKKLQAKEGKKIHIRVLRQGERLKKSFYLKDLL
jgi:hypothetical protein